MWPHLPLKTERVVQLYPQDGMLGATCRAFGRMGPCTAKALTMKSMLPETVGPLTHEPRKGLIDLCFTTHADQGCIRSRELLWLFRDGSCGRGLVELRRPGRRAGGAGRLRARGARARGAGRWRGFGGSMQRCTQNWRAALRRGQRRQVLAKQWHVQGPAWAKTGVHQNFRFAMASACSGSNHPANYSITFMSHETPALAAAVAEPAEAVDGVAEHAAEAFISAWLAGAGRAWAGRGGGAFTGRLAPWRGKPTAVGGVVQRGPACFTGGPCSC